MRINFLKSISLALSILTASINPLQTFAYNLDENNNSVEMIEYQTTDEYNFTNAATVLAELKSIYNVTIPKRVVLSGESKDAAYFVKVEGDIAGYETLNIVPDDKFNLYTKNKNLQIANITQDKTAWKYNDFDTDANGIIDAKDITAGKWQGTFNFNIFLSSEEEKVAGNIFIPDFLDADYRLIISKLNRNVPGLYDENGNLIVSFDYISLHNNMDTTTLTNKGTASLKNIVETKYKNTNYIVLPDTYKTIETDSLNIEGIKYVDIPSSVNIINHDAFGPNILYVNVPENVNYYQNNIQTYSSSMPVKNITINLEDNNTADIILEKGYTYRIEALYNFYDDVTRQSTIKSNNENVVLYRPIYFLDAVNVGETTISGIYNSLAGKKEALINVSVIDPHTHIKGISEQKNIKQPTCVLEGSYDEYYTCNTCGEAMGTTKKIIPALGHNYINGICTRCGAKTNRTVTFSGVSSNTSMADLHNTYYFGKLGYRTNDHHLFKNDIETYEIVVPSMVEEYKGVWAEVTEISYLSYCYYVRTVKIPKSVKKIKDNCFYDFLLLDTIIYEGTTEEWNSIQKGSNLFELFSSYKSWLTYTRTVTVRCTDGNIIINKKVK